MKRFASNRLYIPHMGIIMRNQVVEVDEVSGYVVSCFPFTEEISFTEWLGGLIVISDTVPSFSDLNDISAKAESDDNKKTGSVSSVIIDNTLLKAYHVTDYNVADMCLSAVSRVVLLV